MVRPGRSLISRMASMTPGMKLSRFYRIVLDGERLADVAEDHFVVGNFARHSRRMDDHSLVVAAACSRDELFLGHGGVECAALRLGGGRRDGEGCPGRSVDLRLMMGL